MALTQARIPWGVLGHNGNVIGNALALEVRRLSVAMPNRAGKRRIKALGEGT